MFGNRLSTNRRRPKSCFAFQINVRFSLNVYICVNRKADCVGHHFDWPSVFRSFLPVSPRLALRPNQIRSVPITWLYVRWNASFKWITAVLPLENIIDCAPLIAWRRTLTRLIFGACEGRVFNRWPARKKSRYERYLLIYCSFAHQVGHFSSSAKGFAPLHSHHSRGWWGGRVGVEGKRAIARDKCTCHSSYRSTRSVCEPMLSTLF